MSNAFRGIRIGLLLIALPLSLAAGDRCAADPYKTLLRQAGITPDAPGLKHYLRQLFPDEATRHRQEALIEQLGADTFARREAAMQRLKKLPMPPLAALVRARNEADPEISWRANELLRGAERQSQRMLLAVFKCIEQGPVSGIAPEVLAAMEFCDQPPLREAARAALAATSTADDTELLREALKRDQPLVRQGASRALAQLLGEDGLDELAELLDDDDPWVRLEVALALGNLGDRRSLEALVDLMDADQMRVRLNAARSLRGLTGQQLVFTAYADEQTRRDQVQAWRQWVAEHGQEAELSFPIRDNAVEFGRTLVCYYGRNVVVEYDVAGKKVWECADAGLRYPWSAVGLPNGHRLVCWYSSRTVVEYDTEGKEVWRKAGLPSGPRSVQRLENGNTLIACYGANQVIEVSPEGDTTWTAAVNRPYDAQRLTDGTTLVSSYSTTAGRIVEIDREGNETEVLSGLRSPRSVQRLPNEHLLVSERSKKRVVEFDRAGNEVWSQENLGYVNCAQRLSNGNTLISTTTGVREIDAEGSEVWTPSETELGTNRMSAGVFRY